jgi:hypothetical protein
MAKGNTSPRPPPGEEADIDGYFNSTTTPFDGTKSDDYYRKIADWTDGEFKDGTPGHLDEDITSGEFYDDADPRTGWKDDTWAKSKHVPEKAICE